MHGYVCSKLHAATRLETLVSKGRLTNGSEPHPSSFKGCMIPLDVAIIGVEHDTFFLSELLAEL